MSKLKITVDGDAKGGWIVGVHDGDNHDSYSPEAESAEEAAAKAAQMHYAAFNGNAAHVQTRQEPAPTEPVPAAAGGAPLAAEGSDPVAEPQPETSDPAE